MHSGGARAHSGGARTHGGGAWACDGAARAHGGGARARDGGARTLIRSWSGFDRIVAGFRSDRDQILIELKPNSDWIMVGIQSNLIK